MERVMEPLKFWSENPVPAPISPDKFDSIVIVASDFQKITFPSSSYLADFLDILKNYYEVDKAFHNVETFLVPNLKSYQNIKVLVYSPTGPLCRDYDDVRRFADATMKGVKRILKSGQKRPLLVILDPIQKFKYSDLVSLLAAGEAIYVPLEIREDVPHKVSKVQTLGVYSPSNPEIFRVASAIESGRVVCRDIGGSDPERMSAPNVALYVQEIFANTCINVEVIENPDYIAKEYPLLNAVNRATRDIKRHQARVIFLTYVPEGPYEKTIALVGKGVTYDSGGLDIKTDGDMLGMHRDKCGAAAIAGFFQTLSMLKPKNIKVIGAMAMVRNSVGPDGYVTDEILISRSGVRIRVGNTDAEGRMAMADVLCHVKEKIVNEKDPYLFTIATLTSHACLTVGDGYSIVLENGPAKAESVGRYLQISGDEIGDLFEISTIRCEDYEFHKGKSEYEDILQSNNASSSKTARGHQAPAAFLIMSSGLDKHGLDSDKPLKYCHIDIAPSSGPYPGIPSGAPIPALTKCFAMA